MSFENYCKWVLCRLVVAAIVLNAKNPKSRETVWFSLASLTPLASHFWPAPLRRSPPTPAIGTSSFSAPSLPLPRLLHPSTFVCELAAKITARHPPPFFLFLTYHKEPKTESAAVSAPSRTFASVLSAAAAASYTSIFTSTGTSTTADGPAPASRSPVDPNPPVPRAVSNVVSIFS